MKYRVRIDFPFDSETDARNFLTAAKTYTSKVKPIITTQEIAFYQLELCGHDEGKPCTILEQKRL